MIVRDYRKSGEPARSVAERWGVGVASLYAWSSKFQEFDGDATEFPQVVELITTDDAPSTSRSWESYLVRVGAVEIEFPVGTAADYVAAVVATLTR